MLTCCRTVTDVGVGDNPAGLAVAAMSVVSSGMQQIFCRTMQQKHKLSSHELLANTAPAQVGDCCSSLQIAAFCTTGIGSEPAAPAAGLDVAGHWTISGPLCQQLLGFRLQLYLPCTGLFGSVLQHGSVCEHITVHVPGTLFSSIIPGQPFSLFVLELLSRLGSCFA